MSLQSTLNQQAIEMLPRCAFFLKTFGGSDVRLVRAICNSAKALEKMNASELNNFDLNQLSALLKERMDVEESRKLDNFEEESFYFERSKSA